MEEKTKNIALLIDSENVSAKYVKNIFDELNSYGTVSIRRIYGNWTKSSGWKEDVLLEYSIQPIQQFDYTKGKNANDMAMVIDAMDILYSHRIDTFCLVTSDSDFTRLAMRLRESQIHVIGMGESKTPLALTKACNKFVHLDLISSANEFKENGSAQDDKNKEFESAVTPLEQIQETVINLIAENEELTLGQVGSTLGNHFSDFDVRNYGYTKLSVMIKEEFHKIKLTKSTESNNIYYVSLENDHTDINTVKTEIIDFITKQGGTVENLSKIYEYLKQKHKDFDLKDYGFSRFSSFLRRINEVSVNENIVQLKKKKEK